MDSVYTFRSSFGIIEYKVIKHNDDYSVLTIKDTSCFGHTSCILQVITINNGRFYIADSPLNDSAFEHWDLHKNALFYIDKAVPMFELVQNQHYAVYNKLEKLKRSASALTFTERELPVNFLSIDTWGYNTIYYCEDYAEFEIVGKIIYKDNSTGFLIKWLCPYNSDDGDEDCRSNELIVNENSIYLKNDKDKLIFNSVIDYNNYTINKCNKENKNKYNSIWNEIKYYTYVYDKLTDIIEKYNQEGIPADKMFRLYKDAFKEYYL